MLPIPESADTPPAVVPATAGDAAAIATAHVRAWQAAYVELFPADYLAGLSVDVWTRRWDDALSRSPSRTLIVRDDRGVAGFVSFGASRDADAAEVDGEIWALYVSPACWGRGIGRTLLAAAVAGLAADGHRVPSLWVLARNARARGFYGAGGFVDEPGAGKVVTIGGVRLEEIRMRRAAVPTPIDVRRLVPADAPAYRRLMLSAYARSPDAFTSTVAEREPLPLSWWAARVAEEPQASHVVHGAFAAGALVGVAGLEHEQRERLRHKATLFGLYVHPAYRGAGIGARLMDAVLLAAAASGRAEVVQLTVTASNTAGLALYARCGFVAFGTEPMAVRSADGYLDKVHLWRRVAVPVTRVP